MPLWASSHVELDFRIAADVETVRCIPLVLGPSADPCVINIAREQSVWRLVFACCDLVSPLLVTGAVVCIGLTDKGHSLLIEQPDQMRHWSPPG